MSRNGKQKTAESIAVQPQQVVFPYEKQPVVTEKQRETDRESKR